jgi:hypothetical protein
LQFLTWQTKDLIDRAALEQELWHGWRLTVKLSGPRQRGALAAMRMIDSQRIAAKVPCWCGSARAEG